MIMSTDSSSQLGIPVAIVIAGALIAGALFFAQPKPAPVAAQPAPAQPGAPVNQGPQIIDQTVKGVQPGDHIVGNPNAKVVIVEFSDAECPFCKMFHDTMNKLMKEYGPGGNVAWVYRNYPLPQLHRKAEKEAIALECAGKLGGNDAFWKFTNNLYAVTPSNDGLDHTQLPGMAEKAGVDKAAFKKCFDNDETKDLVAAHKSEGEALNIGGTPQSFIISGGKQVDIEGAQRYDTVKQTIEMMLKK
jgi:protein-disulfide isomerase